MGFAQNFRTNDSGGNAKRPATEASRDKDVESGAGDKKRAAAATAGVASSGAAAVAAGRTGVKRRRSGDLSGVSRDCFAI